MVQMSIELLNMSVKGIEKLVSHLLEALESQGSWFTNITAHQDVHSPTQRRDGRQMRTPSDYVRHLFFPNGRLFTEKKSVG